MKNNDEQVHYYRGINQILFTAFEEGNIVGTFCLGFAAALFEETDVPQCLAVPQMFTTLSVAQAREIYRRLRACTPAQLAEEYGRITAEVTAQIAQGSDDD